MRTERCLGLHEASIPMSNKCRGPCGSDDGKSPSVRPRASLTRVDTPPSRARRNSPSTEHPPEGMYRNNPSLHSAACGKRQKYPRSVRSTLEGGCSDWAVRDSRHRRILLAHRFPAAQGCAQATRHQQANTERTAKRLSEVDNLGKLPSF